MVSSNDGDGGGGGLFIVTTRAKWRCTNNSKCMTTRGNDFLIPYIDSLISSWTADTKKFMDNWSHLVFCEALPKKNTRKQKPENQKKKLPRNYQLRMKHAIARLDCFNLRTRENNFTQSSRLCSIYIHTNIAWILLSKKKTKHKTINTNIAAVLARPLGALNYAIPATADWVVRYVCVYVYPFSFFRVEFSFKYI